MYVYRLTFHNTDAHPPRNVSIETNAHTAVDALAQLQHHISSPYSRIKLQLIPVGHRLAWYVRTINPPISVAMLERLSNHGQTPPSAS